MCLWERQMAVVNGVTRGGYLGLPNLPTSTRAGIRAFFGPSFSYDNTSEGLAGAESFFYVQRFTFFLFVPGPGALGGRRFGAVGPATFVPSGRDGVSARSPAQNQ